MGIAAKNMKDAENREILQNVKCIHFVGIGGSGMCPLAEILHARGYTITGSDVNPSDNVSRLQEMGISIAPSQTGDNLISAELVVYTSAVNPTNPEIMAAKEKGIPLIERGHLLGLISQEYANTVAVAGTHGKTTTSSMISQILLKAGLDPTVFIGGKLPMINANGRVGGSDIMVCEACEFQDHYLFMKPAVAIVLNVDADHLDYFGDLNGVIKSFRSFTTLASDVVIINADDDNTVTVGESISGKTVITYGSRGEFNWTARNSQLVKGAYGEYDLYHDGNFFARITLGVPGLHNISNSMAAAAAAHICGATAEQIVDGLASFCGAGRRFEFLGTHRYVTIADDYAHHPTEISATLSAAKSMGYQNVWAIFQPFTFSRTERHLDEFIQSLSAADQVILSDIMGSREENSSGITSENVTSRISGALYLPTFEEITEYVVSHVKEGDLVLTMGGGDVYKCARMIAARLDETS